jgi:localization factor PodJL
MADTPSPWSVKGVDPEAREAAKIAARKAGMTVGAWLTQMIRQTAVDQLRRPRPGQPPPERPPEYADPMASAPYGGAPGYGQHAAPPPPPGGAPPPAPTIQAIFDSIQRLSSRIEQSEQRTADTIAPIAQKVGELSEQLEQARMSGMSTAPVERAVQRISERLDRIEDGGRPVPRAAERPPASERRGFLGLFRRD